MLPDREGLFHAHPTEIGVDETGPNRLATVIIRFRLFEELDGDTWRDCFDEGLEITGYFYLEKRDGAVNEMVYSSLKEALGWDGRDPFRLEETDLSEQPVQVKLGFESYNGTQRLKVKYLNPYGSTGGGVSKADESTRTSIRNRLGPKLRAHAGPARTAKPKDTSPPKNKPPAKPPAGKKPPAESTMEEAWQAFCAACDPETWDREAIEKEWFRIIADLFNGKTPEELTPGEWATMRDKGPGAILPF